ncbi:MAG TPA: DUF2179 domain-containing protein [Bacteroidaceae bacterium]|nr:DUF2179 domain-containing protein [Bacteroidaceae bacterium]
MDSFYFDYIILPVLIFLARIIDVPLDTLRVIMVSKGYRRLAPYIGFFQVLIWIITITRIMENLDNWLTYVAYAAGFGTGIYVGMVIEEKIAMGYELLRVITRAGADELIAALREQGYTVTVTIGEGRDGKVGIIFLYLKRKVIKDVIEIVKKFNPNAFYTIEDMRFVRDPEYLTSPKRSVWAKMRGR